MKLKVGDVIDKLIFISLIIVCLSIFLIPVVKTIALTLLTVSLFGAFLSKKYIIKLNLDKSNIVFLLFFALYIIGVFYSSNKEAALFDLQVKLPMLLFPLLFLILPKNFVTKENLRIYSLTFIIGLVLTIFYCFLSGAVRAVTNSVPLIPEIIYTKLSANFHPSYLSLFAAVGLVLTYKISLSEIIKTIIIVLISIFLIMLNSRSGFIIMIIAYFWIVIDMFFIRKRKILAITTFLIVFLSFFFVLNSDILSLRYHNAINNISQNKNVNHEANSISQRSFIYSNSLSLISENIVFGVGSGDIKSTLESLYEKKNVHFHSYLNAHNQYLQTTIALGLLGLSVLLLIFLFPMIKAIRTKEYFLLTIFLLIGFAFLFESMLERNMGTYFFALIYVLSNAYLSKNDELIV